MAEMKRLVEKYPDGFVRGEAVRHAAEEPERDCESELERADVSWAAGCETPCEEGGGYAAGGDVCYA
jgi:hypothetical protein